MILQGIENSGFLSPIESPNNNNKKKGDKTMKNENQKLIDKLIDYSIITRQRHDTEATQIIFNLIATITIQEYRKETTK